MYIVEIEMLLQNELAELNSEIEKGTHHLNDLKSGKYDFYNEAAITKLQNKIYFISGDIKSLLLGNYLTSLQHLAKSISRYNEKESCYNDIMHKLYTDLANHRDAVVLYRKNYFGS
jgi:hypothetical protein